MDDEAKCTCTGATGCAEDAEFNNCPVCEFLDIYEPCPRLGFGCGMGSDMSGTEQCDCCSPEQFAAAGRAA
jgi:hypothetical protein